MTDAYTRTYFTTSGAVAMEKLRVEHIMQETIHCLKKNIFGNAWLSLQSYIKLKHTMTTIKIGKIAMSRNGVNNSTPTKTIYQDVCGWQELSNQNSLNLMVR